MANLKFLTDPRTIQSFLNKQLNGAITPLKVDGDFGFLSRTAARALIAMKLVKAPGAFSSRVRGGGTNSLVDQQVLTLVEQIMFTLFFPKDPPLVFDGISGPSTSFWAEKYQNAIRDLSTPESLSPVPKTNTGLTKPGFVKPDFGRQKDMVANFGNPGDEKNLVRMDSPYTLYLDWSLGQTVKSFLIHKKVRDSARAAMEAVLEHYGAEEIHKLGLDQFGGCYNPRKMRGGSSWSMHAWAVAIDWDADRNPLRSNSTNAYFSTNKKTHKFLDIWEAHGWTSLGRVRNFDWMHVQAPRL